MPTETLSAGPVHTMIPLTVYALPPHKCHVFAMGPGAAGVGANIQFSNDGVVWAAALATPQSVDTGAAFIRCDTANVLVTTKRA